MLFFPTLPLLALSYSSCVLAVAQVDVVTVAGPTITEYSTLPSIGVNTACSAVSGLASPRPSFAVCDSAPPRESASFMPLGLFTRVSSGSSRDISSTTVVTALPSAATSSLTTTQSLWTSVETDPALYDMAITTTYTQSPQCTGEVITQMAYHGTNLWENAIKPVATSTITTCYPSQFYSSVIGALSSVALPAFSALVCPHSWETIKYNETYIVCCPNNFNVNAPNYHNNADRPFSGAACTSSLGPDELFDITSYDSTAYWTIVPTTASDDGTVIRVNAFDGIIATATLTATAAATTTGKTTASEKPATTISNTVVKTSSASLLSSTVSFELKLSILYSFILSFLVSFLLV